MTPAHEAHLQEVLAEATAIIDRKYRKGQAEHGGNLWENEHLLDEAINEAADELVYLITEKKRRQRAASIKAAQPVLSVDGPDGWSSGTLTPI